MIRRILPLLAPPLLAGCASESGRIPSLAPRAAETHGFEEPAAPPPAVANADPALDARIAEAAARSGEDERGFAAARAAAEAKVAAVGRAPAGSEAWLDGQVALGELDVARAEAGEAVTTLETLAADRAVAGEAPYPALETALAAARARQEEIVRTIAELGARLDR
jgi:hypothetical protein